MKKILILSVALIALAACTTPVHIERTATVENIQQTSRYGTHYHVRAWDGNKYRHIYTDSLYEIGSKIIIY